MSGEKRFLEYRVVLVKDEPSASEKGRAFGHAPGLSAKLLLLTILFIMLAEVLVFVPSVSNFRGPLRRPAPLDAARRAP